MKPASRGRLILVGTPLGNLGDLSVRAIETLRDVDVVYCEDTRETRKLLIRMEIRTPLRTYLGGREKEKRAAIIQAVERGDTVAVVSDRGMPGFSDPGEELVREALAAGIEPEVVPGPTAAVTALVLSGLPTERFVFLGFLPKRRRDRDALIDAVAPLPWTLVVYESPHRLHETVMELWRRLGSRRCAVLREMTKRYEEAIRGTLDEVAADIGETTTRGEYVVVIEGEAQTHDVEESEIAARLSERAVAGHTRRDAVEAVARECGAPKNRVYEIALSLDLFR